MKKVLVMGEAVVEAEEVKERGNSEYKRGNYRSTHNCSHNKAAQQDERGKKDKLRNIPTPTPQ